MTQPKITLIICLLTFFFFSCKEEKKATFNNEKEEIQKQFDETEYVLDDSFPVGDARRYGLTAENSKTSHPTSGKNRMTTVLDLAEKSGMEIIFPAGYYGMDLTLDSRNNMTLRFNNSEFNLIHITQNKDTLPKPENITLKGTLISYARLGLTEARNISIDSVILKSDTSKNLWGLRNTGCHIYHGCKDIKINYLEVQDLGSGSERYKYSHAALAIDGYNNNPENVQIKKVHIKSTDRHGIYMTGKDHLIGEVIIDKFGIGDATHMDGMQDAAPGEEKEFKALWINKCYDSFIENIIINEKDSKGTYTAHFDSGDMRRPVIIGNFKVLNDQTDMTILEDDNHGVIIEIKE
ncbi:hypothetical protein [Gelidibacter maritimus]|uniref:DUF1565 domain-containing protein n=1 Tax=Gelidibacter maritimus TaxID=2761487 RepID=A0A7W2M3Q4_9FLAO|nr:hypothetical protein [Gelidibacter maritimus]MBA6151926.1 hypothetical protein [Gelidibacter maritimus]